MNVRDRNDRARDFERQSFNFESSQYVKSVGSFVKFMDPNKPSDCFYVTENFTANFMIS